MSSRIGISPSADRSSTRGPQDLKAEKDFSEAVAPKRPVARESFISSVLAARQPPPLPLDDVIPQVPGASALLFGSEVENLSRLSEADVAGDLAEVYLTHVERAMMEGGPEIADAFETLGELMVNYEHLRMLRTGEMG